MQSAEQKLQFVHRMSGALLDGPRDAAQQCRRCVLDPRQKLPHPIEGAGHDHAQFASEAQSFGVDPGLHPGPRTAFQFPQLLGMEGGV